jgi:formylglycine-generating enzyme required for sulfatase activity
MRCPNPACGKLIPGASRYCAYCGALTRPAVLKRGWPAWIAILLLLAGVGGGTWAASALRPSPTPQVIKEVVTQVVLATPGPSPTPQVIKEVVTQVVLATPGPSPTPRPPAAGPTQAPAPTQVLTPGPTQVADKDGMILLYVEAGEFLMGSAASDSEANNDEKPPHKVYLDAYWIDRTEVTKEQYQKCVAAGKCAAPSCSGTGQGDHPVVCVSWQDAADYCAWAGRRLPTEAEWEKAARGTDGRKYPWGNEPPDDRRCNFNQNVRNTTPADNYLAGASPYGALDMAGNVWEWTADWYNETYYSGVPTPNPQGPESGQYRVLRGGSWDNNQRNVRAACRYRNNPDFEYYIVGFRCARS